MGILSSFSSGYGASMAPQKPSAPPLLAPHIALCGKTGAGKSSLVNALLQADVQRVGVVPETRERTRLAWQPNPDGSPAANLAASPTANPNPTSKLATFLVDTPGLMEAGRHDEYAESLLDTLAGTHVLLWVIGYPDRAIEVDRLWIEKIHKLEPKLPILVVGTAIDRADPRRFDAKNFRIDLNNPDGLSTEGEKKASSWGRYLRDTLLPVGATDVVICAAGESSQDHAGQCNLMNVHNAVQKCLPEAAQLDFIRRSRVLGPKGERATLIIKGAAAAAAAAAVVPVPLVDAVAVTGIQIGMVISLSALYERPLDKNNATQLVTAALTAVVGRALLQQVSKLIPGIGSTVGAALAGALTYAVGEGLHDLLKQGATLDEEAIRNATKRAYQRRKS